MSALCVSEPSVKTIVREWATALRSGEFIKCVKSLRGKDNRRDCMGVLVETMYRLTCAEHWKWVELEGRWGVCREVDGRLVHSWGVLPAPFLAEVGLTTVDQCELQRLNDEGKSFKYLASYVEKNFLRA